LYDDGLLNVRGKYAHIVGNGWGNGSRSNAHTLDWDGNAWFAGDVYVGGTGQDDPNAKKLIALALPDPASGPRDGCAIVNTNGAWTLTSTPVATMDGLSQVSTGVSVAHGRIDAVEEDVTSLGMTISTMSGGVSSAHSRIDELEETMRTYAQNGSNMSVGLTDAHNRIDALETAAGDIDAALDSILDIQEELINSAIPSAEGVEF
jgi:hypothetical protein